MFGSLPRLRLAATERAYAATGLVRRGLARFDVNNHATLPPRTLLQRREIAGRNVLDTALFTANAVVAGTPIAWVTAPAQMLAGAAKVACALCIDIVGGKHLVASKLGASGLCLLAGGLAALVPIAGSAVNGTLAALTAANAINTAMRFPAAAVTSGPGALARDITVQPDRAGPTT